MRTSDQRRFWIACPHCAEEHTPTWSHVVIPRAAESEPAREVYGRYRWEDAAYHCPHCGAQITDDERILAIRRAAAVPPLYGWRPEAQSTTAGFYSNELLSIFDGSRVPHLARKFLEAQHELDEGKPEAMIVFRNSTEGLPWEYSGELPEEEELRARAEDYPEWSTLAFGLVPVMTVDVQHDRLAVTVYVFGRGEEMCLAYWGELYGQTIVPHAGAWAELEDLMKRTVRHPTGAELPIRAIGIDCSDGQTSDASYAFVRRHNRSDRQVLALKGAPDDVGRAEIWRPPKPIDPNRRATKASKHGVQIHIVGTAKAKDLILGWAQEGGRVRLTGSGPGRMHWYRAVRPDFWEQLLSEIKVPSRTNPRLRVWKARSDRRQEGLDCTVYAIYVARVLGLHLRRPGQWDIAELTLRQISIIYDPELQTPAAAAPEPPPADEEAEDAEEAEETVPASVPAPLATPPPAPAAARQHFLSMALKHRRERAQNGW